MGQYYFVVASLPALSLSLEPAQHPSVASFLELCREWLHRRDMALVEQATLLSSSSSLGQPERNGPPNHLIRRWYAFEYRLRNEVARQRAARLRKDAAPYLRESAKEGLRPVASRLAEVVRAAVQEENPLEAERILDRARWQFLDELGWGHYFDVEALQVYHLRLQILARAGLFTADRGAQRFQQSYEAVVMSIRDGQHQDRGVE